MQRRLGDHRAPAIARASGYGMVSSSCSYAASAMAKSLFAKGADFVAAMVFMFASTNLVIELGIVLVVLMGWQFAVSEFVGGVIMIVLLAVLGALWLRGRVVAQARRTASRSPRTTSTQHGHRPTRRAAPWSARARTVAGWSDSATYTMSDLVMLRRELLIGYTVAGFLAVLVPTSVWQAVFITGHGFWTTLENALVGPFIAIISFVCSIGNVPLAAALWTGGISFGGVIAFIFADLIAFPLLLIYRRYYGTRLMLRMLVVFWALMSTAGLLTELLFRAAGLVPTTRPVTVAPALSPGTPRPTSTSSSWCSSGSCTGSTATGRGSGAGIATHATPCAGCRSRRRTRPASLEHDGRRYSFCSDRCAERFAAGSARREVRV